MLEVKLIHRFLVLLFLLSLTVTSFATATKLTFMGWGDPAEQESYKQYIEAFKQIYPDIDVEILPLTGSYSAKIYTMTAAGIAPDVFMVNQPEYLSFIANNLIEDITDMMARDTRFQARRGDIFPPLLEAFAHDGRWYGLPKDSSPRMFFYNMDLFDAAGITYPKSSWTWNTFLEITKKLTRRTPDGKLEQLGFEGTDAKRASDWVEWIRGVGSDIVDRPVDPTRSTLATPAAQEGLHFVVDLMWKHGVAARPNERKAFQLVQGNTAIASQWRSIMQSLKNSSFRWDLTVPPRGNVPSVSLAASAYAVSTTSKNKEAAWNLVRFLSSDPISQKLHGATGNAVPNLRTVVSSSDFLSKPLPVNNQAYLQVMEYAVPVYPLSVHFGDMQKIYTEELTPVWKNQRDVESATLAIDQRINSGILKSNTK